MATEQQIRDLAGLYVAYFDRAPDPAGLKFWIDQLDNGRPFATIAQDFANSVEARSIYDFLEDPSSSTPTEFVSQIYINLFGRAPDTVGLNFWVDVLESGAVAPGDMVEAVMLGAQDTVVDGQVINDMTTVNNKIDNALYWSDQAMMIEGFVFDNAAYVSAQEAIDGVQDTPESAAAGRAATDDFFNDFLDSSTFTLCEKTVEITEPDQLVTNTVIYWGYNPHPRNLEGVDNEDGNDPNGNDNNLTNEGPEDGGISAEVFFNNYLPSIADTLGFPEFFGDGVDVNFDEFSVIDFPALTSIELEAGEDGNGGTISFTYPDGSADDIVLTQEYFNFLSDLIFDEEGNSRFFEQEVAAQVPVFLDDEGEPTTDPDEGVGDPIGYIDAVLSGETTIERLPIILTPTENNGGTFENGFTSDENDFIQAGQLELLHGAIIDGGGGFNTLEVDAKGHFAQPKSLQNIQEVVVTNLANVYNEDEQTTTYPILASSDINDSILDLTRAEELRNVTIIEGDYFYEVDTGLDTGDANSEPGALIVTGLRNDATLTLQGSYSQDVYVRTGEGFDGNGFDVILENVNAENNMYIADNAPTLNLISQGAGNKLDGLSGLNDASVSHLNISGNAKLFIESDLASITDDDTPLTIDASANAGGVDLNTGNELDVTFIGSQGDDRFAVSTNDDNATTPSGNPPFTNDDSVTITNTVGDNYYNISTYDLSLTDGDGDVNVEFSVVRGDVTLGDGDNHVEGSAVNFVATAGEGDNKFDVRAFDSPQNTVWTFEDDYPTLVDLTAGDGRNIFNVFVDDATLQGDGPGPFLAPATINITAGDGGNLIQIPDLPRDEDGSLSNVTINTGDGNDTMFVGGSHITLNSGGGNDTITLVGIDNDYVTAVNSDKEFSPANFGVTLDIDTGAGSALINLGAFQDNAFLVEGEIIAKEGSVIQGEDITLFVNTHADLRAADLNDITNIIMDDDADAYPGQGFPGFFGGESSSAEGAASLTLLDTQLAELLADGVNFSTQGEFFGAQSVLTIVVTEDTELSDLVDFSAWNDSIKFCFVVEDGVTLTLTAEELHNYVAPEGIVAAFENNGNYTGQVIITDAGPQFDPYDAAYNADNQNGIGGGSVGGDIDEQNVTTIFTPDGFERPTPPGRTDVIEIDSDETPVVEQTVYPFASDMVIEGDADLTLENPIILDENFNVDFSELEGDFTDTTNGVPTITIANFQDITEEDSGARPFEDWGSIEGNGTAADPVRVDILVTDESTTGDTAFGVSNGGFISSGVQQYVLVGFHTEVDFPNGQPRPDGGDLLPQAGSYSATIVVCDKTEDLEVLGMQNNRNSDVTFEQVNWGTEILLEGDGYANASDQEKNLGDPDKSEVGYVTANFFESGANAVVRLTNQGTELGLNEDAEDGFDPAGERILDAAGVTVTNADRLLIEVEDGDAIIRDVTGVDVERLIVNGPEDVELVIQGVRDDPAAGFDSDDLVSIDGTGVVDEFKLTFTEDADLSGVALAGIDAICLDGDITLTMTADQLVQFGAVIETLDDGATILNVGEMGDQPLDLSGIDVDNIGTVTFAEGDITVDPSTDFGGADALVIPEDSNVTMTVAQFYTADGDDDDQPNVIDDGDTFGGGTVTAGPDNEDNNSLTLTEVPNGEPAGESNDAIEIDLTDVSDHVDVNIVLDNFIATPNFDIVGTGETLTLLISGTTDLSAANLTGIDAIVLADGAELTLSEEQLADLQELLPVGGELSDVISVEGGGSATLNINQIDGLYDLGAPVPPLAIFDLDELVSDLAGSLSIGTLSIADTNGAVGEPDDTVSGLSPDDGFGQWTLGGAQAIVMPTADLNDTPNGLEPTTLFLTQEQFFQLADGTVTGDGVVNLIEVTNNNDSDGDIAVDNLLIDTSNITAPKGQLWLLEEEFAPEDVGETVLLDDASDISGFDIRLTDGQRIGFANEDQAATTVIEVTNTPGNPTGIIWLFDTVSGPVDTAGYDAAIDTLFVLASLVDGANEEDLWTFLPGSIEVEKYNGEIPDAFFVINRVNIFEAFTQAPAGITFDDTNEFQTIGQLTLNLEGGVQLGGVTINDTVGDAEFTNLTINSYFDPTSLPVGIGVDTDGDGDSDALAPGFILTANEVGDINILIAQDGAGVGFDPDGIQISIDTSDYFDPSVANGTVGGGNGDATRDGLDVEIGTIFLGTPGTDAIAANMVLDGDNGITIAGIDTSDPMLTAVFINTAPLDPGATLSIGVIDFNDLIADAENVGIADLDDLNQIIIFDDFSGDTPSALVPNTETVFLFRGDNDIKEIPETELPGVGGGGPRSILYFEEAGTLNLTGLQLQELGIAVDSGGDVSNWILGPGVNPGDVTINICELNGVIVDLDLLADAGFNIGTITISEDTELDPGTTLGGADEIVIELGSTDPTISLEMTAEQFGGFSGIISETVIADPVLDPADYEGQVIVDALEAIEEGTDPATVDIDLSQVTTTGDNAVMLSENGGSVVNGSGAAALEPNSGPVTGGDGDVILTDTTDLGTFAVVLNDVGIETTTPANELAGHTIRFATVEQADGRTVIVFEGEISDAEQDTNVVWLFDTIPGPLGLDVSDYDGLLGRIWVSDDLVDSVGGDIDGLFTIDDPDNPGTPLFTLDDDIIKRIESGDLTDALAIATPVLQTIEVVSGAGLAGILAEITDPVQFIETLTIDLGGLTSNGDLEIDNILGGAVLGDDDFELLTLNSFIGDFYVDPDNKHYLLPDDFTIPPNTLPTNSIQFTDPSNVFGDILAGGDRGVLRDVRINTGVGEYEITVTGADTDGFADGDETVTVNYEIGGVADSVVVALSNSLDPLAIASDIAAALSAIAGIAAQANGATVIVNDNGIDAFEVVAPGIVAGGTQIGITAAGADVIGERGTSFVAETIFFSEDTDPEAGLAGFPGVGTLDINGVHDVTVKGIDFTDAEMIVANVDTAGHSGTYTATGGSAAFTGGATTEKLIIDNDSGDTGVVNFGGTLGDNPDTIFTVETDFFVPTEVGGVIQAGIDGEELSSINTSDHGGTVNLGVVARIDGTGMNGDTTAGFNPAETFDGGFNDGFILNNGGTGLVILCLGEAQNTDGSITFPVLEAGGEWTFTGPGIELEMKQVTLEGTLNLNDVDLCINGDIDFTTLEALNVTGGGTIEVKAGATLTLTVAQVDDLEDAGLEIFGEGTVAVTGESDSADGELDTDFGILRTGTVDLSAVTLEAADTVLEIEANGAEDADGDDLVVDGIRIAQTIIGSANNDAVTASFDANDGDATTIDVITRLGADSGNIGVPGETPTTNTPDDLTPEEQGDFITAIASANVRIEVDAGFDTLLQPFTPLVIPPDVPASTIVQVAAGAEFYAQGVSTQWFADAETTNAGIAVIELDNLGNDIDLSMAGGPNGYYIIGSPDDAFFGGDADTIIGSAFDDTLIDGTADGDSNAGAEDSFTGGDGEDLFQFSISSSTPATFTDTEIQAAADVEFIDVTTAALVDDPAALLTIEYTLNNVTTVAVVSDATVGGAGVDFTDQASIAAGIATVMDAVAGISAAVDAGDNTQVNLSGDNGNLLNINAITPNGAAGTAAAAVLNLADDDPNNADDGTDTGDDDAQITEVEITGTVTEGEIYFLTVTLRDGSEIEAQYEAQLGDTLLEVRDGLLANGDNTGINDIAPAGTITAGATAAPNIIRIVDDEDDDGGFAVSLSAGQAVLNGSSSSSVLDGTEANLTEADADVITDFMENDDTISFGLAAGDGNNYDEAAYENTFADALAAANAAFAGDADLVYFLTGTNDVGDGGLILPGDDGGATGLLFVNANNNGAADTVVSLLGVNEGNFDDSNIV